METVEQLKRQITELRQHSHSTSRRMDALNEAIWKLSYSNTPLAAELSAEVLQLADHNQYARGRAFALRNIGLCQMLTDQNQPAKQILEESRRLFLDLNDVAGLALATNTLGATKNKLGDHGAALEDYSTALNLYKKLNDKANVAGVSGNLGSVYYRLGDYSIALDHFYRALPMAVEACAPIVQARAHSNLGDLLWRLGEAEQAIECSQQALDILQKEFDPHNQAAALVNLGAAHHSQRNYQIALKYYSEGLEAARNVGSTEMEAEAHRCLGSTYYEIGDWQEAITHLWLALQLSRKIESRFYESQTSLSLGLLYKRIEDFPRSIEMLYQALELSEKLNSNEIRYKTHLALSEVYEEQNKTAAALVHYQLFHQIWSETYGTAASRRIHCLLLQNGLPKQQVNDKVNSASAVGEVKFGDEPIGLPPRKLREVTEFIKSNLDQNLNLTELAAVLGLNRYYFLRLFKISTGKTPHQFLVEQRVARAKKIMQTTDLPLSEIAMECGFSNQSHLTTHFRSLIGMTPHQFRQSL